jgi:LysM repeat protein
VDPGHDAIWIVEGASLDYLSVFDGLHLYNIAWSDNPVSTLNYWGGEVRKRAAAIGAHRYWVATVMPGWNDTLVPSRTDSFIRDRADGSYYQLCWSGAVASAPDMVIITSFNEWAEGSTIEPSVGYGDFYLNLTAQMAAAYKAGSVPAPAPPPAAEDTATPEVTVVVPATLVPTAIPPPANSPTPRPSPTALPDGSIVHVVQAGDTLLAIAERYNMSLDDLLFLNDLNVGDLLWIGQPIVIGITVSTTTPEPAPSVADPTASMILTVTETMGGGSAAGINATDGEEDVVLDTETELVTEEATSVPVAIVAPRLSQTEVSSPVSTTSPARSATPSVEPAGNSTGICVGSPLLLVCVALWFVRNTHVR